MVMYKNSFFCHIDIALKLKKHEKRLNNTYFYVIKHRITELFVPL